MSILYRPPGKSDYLVPQLAQLVGQIEDRFVGSAPSLSIAGSGNITPAVTYLQDRYLITTGDLTGDRVTKWTPTDTIKGPIFIHNTARVPNTNGYVAAVRSSSYQLSTGGASVIIRPNMVAPLFHNGTDVLQLGPQFDPSTKNLIANHIALGNGHTNATAGYLPPYPDQRTGGAAGPTVCLIRETLTNLAATPEVYDFLSGNGPYGVLKFEGLGTWLQLNSANVLPSNAEVYANRGLLQDIGTHAVTHAGKLIGTSGEVFNNGTNRHALVYCGWLLYNHSSTGTAALVVAGNNQIDTSSGSGGLLDIATGSLVGYTLAGSTDITSGRGLESYLSITGTGTDIGVFYPIRVDSPVIAAGNTVGYNAGIDIFDQTHALITTNWNFRSRGTTAKNLIEGSLEVNNKIIGSSAANGDLTLEGTSHATKATSFIILQPSGGYVGVGGTPLDFHSVTFNDNSSSLTGYAVKNTNSGSGAYSGMLYYDHNGALTVFQGYNNNSGEFRFNNVSASPSISFRISSTVALLLDTNRNVGVGASAFGTSGVRVLGIANGTEPTSSPADMIQLYSVDLSAGNATLGLRTETAVVTEAVTSDRTLSIRINGTTYKLLLKA